MGRLKGLPKTLHAAPASFGYSPDGGPKSEQARARAAGNRLRPLYSLKPWRDLRLVILERAEWMCQGCEVPHLLIGKPPAPHSPVIDHITPHKGNLFLFWDETNLQAVCKFYHDGEKQRLEASTTARAEGEGWV